MARMKREKKSFEQKVRDLDEHFVEEVLPMSPEQLGDKLISLTKYGIELTEEKENDEDLKTKREALAEAGKVYSEGLKAIKLKQKYIFNLLSNQGAVDHVTHNNQALAKAVNNLKRSVADDTEITVSVNGGKEVRL